MEGKPSEGEETPGKEINLKERKKDEVMKS